MREGAQPLAICVFCKLPITKAQRPSVTLDNGDEIHIECYDSWERTQPRPPDKKPWDTLKRLRDSTRRKKFSMVTSG